MTYSECLAQLEEQGLKEEFCSLFEPKFSKRLLKRLKSTIKINSLASLIRMALNYLGMYSNEWNRWVDILQWYMTPVFARKQLTP